MDQCQVLGSLHHQSLSIRGLLGMGKFPARRKGDATYRSDAVSEPDPVVFRGVSLCASAILEAGSIFNILFAQSHSFPLVGYDS